MTTIYSSSALKTKQREVKDAALKDVVHITENGNGAFGFCSEKVFDEKLREAAEAAAYEERVRMAVERGRDDIASGRLVEGTGNALAEIARRRASRG